MVTCDVREGREIELNARLCTHRIALVGHGVSDTVSLVSRPLPRERGPGTHCVHMHVITLELQDGAIALYTRLRQSLSLKLQQKACRECIFDGKDAFVWLPIEFRKSTCLPFRFDKKLGRDNCLVVIVHCYLQHLSNVCSFCLHFGQTY